MLTIDEFGQLHYPLTYQRWDSKFIDPWEIIINIGFLMVDAIYVEKQRFIPVITTII